MNWAAWAAWYMEGAWHPWAMAVILVLLLTALIRSTAPPDVLVLGATVLTGLLGIIPAGEVFHGYANEGLLTIAALFVVAAGLRETGALDTIGRWVLGSARSERGVVVRLAGSVTIMSAFLNNTPIVAMFIPVVSNWCQANRVSASRLLMPLSYLTILGGTCTLIGTSTNLVVSGLMAENGFEPMHLFELSAVGVPYAIVGIVYLLFIGPRFLPQRRDLSQRISETQREYLVNVRIEPGCRLDGLKVEDAGLRHLPGLFLIEIDRGGEIITPVAPNQVLEAGDILTFTGLVDTIVELERIPGLVPVADENYETESAKRRGRMLHEAVVSSHSPLIDKTIRDTNFRATYNAAVIAVHRGRERLKGKVGDIVLRPGDTLLLQTGPHFEQAYRNNPDFFLVSSVRDSRAVRHDRAVISVVLLAALVVLMATQALPIVLAAYLVAGLMILLRCVGPGIARQSIDWQTLLTIGAAFGLASALEASGLVDIVAGGVVSVTRPFGAVAVLAGVYLLTSAITESVTNNAAAALMFPFALAVAESLGVDARPFFMAIAFAASASFVTPLGYQTNLMVYGPGGYRFTDYMRVGLPLNLILFCLATLLIPRVWPF